jgi:hypothetical protein
MAFAIKRSTDKKRTLPSLVYPLRILSRHSELPDWAGRCRFLQMFGYRLMVVRTLNYNYKDFGNLYFL